MEKDLTMNKAIVAWGKIFERHAGELKGDGGMTSTELRIRLKTMIDLISLRWTLRPPKATEAAREPSLHELLSASEEPPSKPRQGGADVVWWDCKTRFIDFDKYAKTIICVAADKYNLKSKLGEGLGEEAPNTAFLKAFGKLSKKKVSWNKLPSVSGEKGLAASLLYIVDPEADLEMVDKEYGGLSHLLARLESALRLR